MILHNRVKSKCCFETNNTKRYIVRKNVDDGAMVQMIIVIKNDYCRDEVQGQYTSEYGQYTHGPLYLVTSSNRFE